VMSVQQQHYQTNNTPINSTRKIRETPSLHDTTFHWVHGNSIPIKLAATIFGLDYISLS
jgi:hypothetical protein